MQPYYDQDGITIYHGDCREVLPSLHGEVLIADPPYGFNLYKSDVDVTGEVLGSQIGRFRSLAIFGYPEWLVRQCIAWQQVPDEWVTWWPTNATCKSGQRGKPLPREQECIAIFGTVPNPDSVTRERTSQRSLRYLQTTQRPNTFRDVARMGDVWTDASPGQAFLSHLRQHPNEKPLTLMFRLVGMLSVVDDVVIDPTCGSGTTLRAAKDLGRRAIGIEIEERYCEIAAKRLSQMVLPFEVVA